LTVYITNDIQGGMTSLDHDLIRDILAWASTSKADGQPRDHNWPVQNADKDHNEKVLKHLMYLHDKGWLTFSRSSREWYAVRRIRLLPPGWDHLDSIKDLTTWERIKNMAKDKGQPLSFEIIKAAASAVAKAAFS
jgi:hypothetical protein